jgi:SAM-dependent methyltransferase
MEASTERYQPDIFNEALLPYEPFISYEHWHRYLYAAALAAGKAVLDVACGEGYGSAYLGRVARRVVGVDVSAEAVAHAAARYSAPHVSFLCGDAAAIPIAEPHSFDVVASFETIEHLDEASQRRFAAEVKRLLKPDGVLLVSTPNRDLYNHESDQHNPYHLREFNRGEFLAFLGERFRCVRLLSQRVFPCSYLWGASPSPLRECQIELADGQFRPPAGDGKEAIYYLAVCSDAEAAEPDASLLIDLSESAFRGLHGHQTIFRSHLYLDQGEGFPAQAAAVEAVDYGKGEFAVTFRLDPVREVKSLRWDPVERRLCRVWLDEVAWTDVDGNRFPLETGSLTANGEREEDGAFAFSTFDPAVFLPVRGCVGEVTLRGRAAVEDLADSLVKVCGVRDDLRRRLNTAEWELGDRDWRLGQAEWRLGQKEWDLGQAEWKLRQAEWKLAHAEGSVAALTAQLEATRAELRRMMEVAQDQSRQLDAADGALREMRRWAEQLQGQCGGLNAQLQAVLTSRRWRAVSKLRSAVYFLPRLISSFFRRRPSDAA